MFHLLIIVDLGTKAVSLLAVLTPGFDAGTEVWVLGVKWAGGCEGCR